MMAQYYKSVLLLAFGLGGILQTFAQEKPTEGKVSWLIPAGAAIGPGQYSYHTLNLNPYQRILSYSLGGRVLVFWDTDEVRFGPLFFSGTTRFSEQVNTNRKFLPGPCTDCHYFTGSRQETGGGAMFETNLNIDRGLWSFFKPLFGSEITFVRIQQDITSSYYFNGRQKMISPVDYVGQRKWNEFRLGFYLGAEAKLSEFLSFRITSSMDIAARNWTILPLGSFLFLPLPTEGTNIRLAPLHSLMLVCRLR